MDFARPLDIYSSNKYLLDQLQTWRLSDQGVVTGKSVLCSYQLTKQEIAGWFPGGTALGSDNTSESQRRNTGFLEGFLINAKLEIPARV